MAKRRRTGIQSTSVATVKSLLSGLEMSTLKEYMGKRLDAKNRLRENFVAYVQTKSGGILICGGDVEGDFYQHQNFYAAFTGYSSGEVTEVRSIICSLASQFRNSFSDEDFHETMVTEVMSSYLKSVMEDMTVPQGLAVEMILVNFRGEVTLLYNTGDSQTLDPNEKKLYFYNVGCYDEKRSLRILQELERLIDTDKKMTDTMADDVILRLKQKFRLPDVRYQVFQFGA